MAFAFVILYLADFRAFGVLQLFIHREKVLHFIKNMGRELLNITIAVIGGVVKRNGDDLFILAAAVIHDDDADVVAAYQG